MSKPSGMQTYLSYLGTEEPGPLAGEAEAAAVPRPPQPEAPSPKPSPTSTVSAVPTAQLLAELKRQTEVKPLASQVLRIRPAEGGATETSLAYAPPVTEPAAVKPAPAQKPTQPGRTADAARPAAKRPSALAASADTSAPAASSGKNTRVLAAAAVMVFGLGIGVWFMPSRGQPGGPAADEAPAVAGSPTPGPTIPAAAAAPPQAVAAASLAGLSAGVTPGEDCLRSSTQTISSDRRDTDLRQIVLDVEAGRSDQALTALRGYTAAACDRATLEAVRILERQSQARRKR